MCAKILETSGKLNMDEYNFFLRGGVVSRSEASRLGTGDMYDQDSGPDCQAQGSSERAKEKCQEQVCPAPWGCRGRGGLSHYR